MVDIAFAAAMILAAVLAVSSVGKALGLRNFQDVLAGTYGLPAGASRTLGLLVVIVEAASAALLMVPATRSVGFATSAIFFVVTLAVAASAYRAGRTGSCGCFGDVVQEQLGPRTLQRLIALVFICGLGLILSLPDRDTIAFQLPAAAAVSLVLAGTAVCLTGLASAARAARAMRRE